MIVCRVMARPPHERAIIYAAIYGELTIDETNTLLEKVGGSKIPKSTFDMVKSRYIPAFKKDPSKMGANIFHPQTLGDLDE